MIVLTLFLHPFAKCDIQGYTKEFVSSETLLYCRTFHRLRNCDMGRRHAGTIGARLSFLVLASSSTTLGSKFNNKNKFLHAHATSHDDHTIISFIIAYKWFI